jgi:heme-degrading monooxygenase HmoA
MRTTSAFARTPRPPYYVVIFSSVTSHTDDGEYQHEAQRMLDLAASQEGFLGIERTRGVDGFGISVSYWTSRSAIAHWKANADHLAAQRKGNEVWYDHYEIRIAKVDRAYGKNPRTAIG